VVALAAMLGAGCSSLTGSSTSTSAGPVEKPDLTVAAVPTLDSAGLYIAEQRGLFAARGLHVKIIPAISGATVLSAQLAGKIDVTIGNYVSYILADANPSHPAKLRILAAGSVMGPNIQMIMVPANSKLTSASQLKGKRIAVNVPDNIGTLLVDSVLNNNAILPSAQNVHYVAMPFPDMAQALKTGKVDAAWMPEPFVTEAEETIGAQPLADADQGTTQNLPIGGYVVTQAWAHKYPRTAAAFRSAILQAQQIADTNNPAVQKAVIEYAHVPPATAAIVASPSFPLRLDPVTIQRVADLMLQFNLLSKGFDTSQMTH
jgi:NitT/TauT family transport system substrate-binding protein